MTNRNAADMLYDMFAIALDPNRMQALTRTETSVTIMFDDCSAEFIATSDKTFTITRKYADKYDSCLHGSQVFFHGAKRNAIMSYSTPITFWDYEACSTTMDLWFIGGDDERGWTIVEAQDFPA